MTISNKSILFTIALWLCCSAFYGQAPVQQKSEIGPDSTPKPMNAVTNGQPAPSQSEEEAALIPYYNNYLKDYHLGPEDVISVQVFGQPNYSKSAIVVPPTARVSYPLIKGGIFVGGKTTDQVAAEITKALDEYIIEPQVTVTLDKVGSARFGVLGKVASPGVRLMNRRYNIYEAIAEAGGIDKDGDKKRVFLVRMNSQGSFEQKVINLEELVAGQSPPPYLVPGDQIIVPEKKWSLTKILDLMSRASAVRILLGSPF